MKKILFIFAFLIGLNSFAQDDFFWSYSHPITNDIITFKPTNTSPRGRFVTLSGDSLLYKSGYPDRIISADSIVQILSSNVLGETHSLESNHNDLISFEITLGYNLNTLDLSHARKLEYVGLYGCYLRTSLGEDYPFGLEYLNNLRKIYLGDIIGQSSYNFYSNPLLKECQINTNNSLTSISFNNPALEVMNVGTNENLTSVSLGTPNPLTDFVYFNGDKLPQSEVDEVLKWCVDGGRTSFNGTCTVDLRGSLMACPSSTGFGYVDILSGRGWNVQVNSCAASLPTVSTLNISNISKYSASSGGNVSSEGSSSVTSRGICFSTSINPTISGSHTTNGSGLGSFISNMTSLSANTTYYIRAYATNSGGTSYGNTISFTTLMEQTNPTLITNTATFITTISATSGGVITSDGGAEIIEKGVCFDTSPNPNYNSSKTNEGSGTASFTSLITGLSPNTTYYVRAYARNRDLIGGFYVYVTGYGQEEVFTTASDVSCNLPNVNTNTVNTITPSSVIGGGNVTNDGNCEVITKGLCWSTLMNPIILDYHTTDGSGIGAFSSSITGLTCGTTYYIRAYATNSSGTAYGNNVSFIPNYLSYTNTVALSAYFHSDNCTNGYINGSFSEACQAIIDYHNPLCTGINKGFSGSTYRVSSDAVGSTLYNYVTGCAMSSVNGYLVNMDNENIYYCVNGVIISIISCPNTVPILTTVSISNITTSSASSGGTVTSDGGESITVKGVQWSSVSNFSTILGSTNDGSGFGGFTSSITGLSENTTYYVRSFATNSIGTGYGNTQSFTTLSNTLSIGDNYEGGVIAYIFQSGDPGYVSGQTHGIIAATNDQSTGIQWYNGSYVITDATSEGILGGGLSNTNKIVSVQGSGSYAAKLCYDLTLNGYSDWVLPNMGELRVLYTNKSLIGGFSSASYWSSYEGTSIYAGLKSFNNGDEQTGNKSANWIYVRAIRYF